MSVSRIGSNKLEIGGRIYTRHDEGETPVWTDDHGFWAGGFEAYLEREWEKWMIFGYEGCEATELSQGGQTLYCRRPKGHVGVHALF